MIETPTTSWSPRYQRAFLSGAGVTNITLQRQCLLDAVDHLAIGHDHIALRDVLSALAPPHARSAICTPVAPGLGG